MLIPLINYKGELVKIELEDIDYIKKDEQSRKLLIGVGRELYYVPSTIQQVSDILRPLKFYRIDKNKIINVSKIDKYKNGIATIGDKDFTVARRNRPAIELEIESN